MVEDNGKRSCVEGIMSRPGCVRSSADLGATRCHEVRIYAETDADGSGGVPTGRHHDM